MISLACLLALASGTVAALQTPMLPQAHQPLIHSRRSALLAPALSLPLLVASPAFAASAPSSSASPDLKFTTAPSGLQFADAKIGSGQPPQKGKPVAVDYVMSTTGARYGSKIYSTKASDAPYRWTLGDGSTIVGLEEAVAGGDGIPSMLPGGVRRVIIPSSLAYESLAKPVGGMQVENCQEGGKGGVGPVPPVDAGTAGEYYQRFKNIYCNANRPYQPDLVMDIKLYGKRN